MWFKVMGLRTCNSMCSTVKRVCNVVWRRVDLRPVAFSVLRLFPSLPPSGNFRKSPPLLCAILATYTMIGSRCALLSPSTHPHARALTRLHTCAHTAGTQRQHCLTATNRSPFPPYRMGETAGENVCACVEWSMC